MHTAIFFHSREILFEILSGRNPFETLFEEVPFEAILGCSKGPVVRLLLSSDHIPKELGDQWLVVRLNPIADELDSISLLFYLHV